MQFLKMTALAAFGLTVAACSSGNENTAPAEAEVNLDAETFDNTITSDEASSLNAAESDALNVATE